MMGEDAAWDWGLALIGFAFGVVAGLGLAYVLLPGSRLARRALEERDSVQHEFDEFRRTVDEHFQKTSDMFHDLTMRYREVYQHLSEGAQSLVRDPLTAPRLEVPDRPLLAAARDTAPPRTHSEGAHDAGDAHGGDSPPAAEGEAAEPPRG